MSQLELGGSLGPKDLFLTAFIAPEEWIMKKGLKEERIWVWAGALPFTSHLMLGKSIKTNSFSLHLLIYKLELMVLAYLTALF